MFDQGSCAAALVREILPNIVPTFLVCKLPHEIFDALHDTPRTRAVSVDDDFLTTLALVPPHALLVKLV